MTHVVLTADGAYLRHVPATLLQLSRFAAGAEGVVVVVPEGTSEESLGEVEGAAERFGVRLRVVSVPWPPDPSSARMLEARGHLVSYTYAKLRMAEALPDLDQVLYLDVDTLVRGPLDSLLDMRLQHSTGGVPELGPLARRLFGTSLIPYVNTGVLRVSLDRWREEGIWAAAMRALIANPRLPYLDQDALNVVLRGRVDLLPTAFNVFDFHHPLARQLAVFDDPAIVHFVGANKPWHATSDSPYAREWRAADAQARGVPEAASTGRSSYAGVRGPGAAVARLRHSAAGRRVRGALPVSVKRQFNRRLLRSVGSRGPQFRSLVAGVMAPPVLDDDAGRAEQPRLVLVLSAQRSGTGALGSLLSEGFPNLNWAGEVFPGYPHPWATAQLVESFPWVLDRQARGRQELVDRHAADIVERLLAASPGPVVVKVFEGHLSDVALEEVCRRFRPSVVIMRRVMAFSAASLSRAEATWEWADTDSTGTRVTLVDEGVTAYTATLDGWFQRVSTLVEEQGLDRVDVTYAGVLETRADLPALRDLVVRAGGRWGAGTIEAWRPARVPQDRRTDDSIAELLRSFGGISTENRARLLRLPGDEGA